MAVDPRWTENQAVARAASGSAGELIPALARIIESGSWREFEHPTHGTQRYETFVAYCDEFVEINALAVEAMLDLSRNRRAAMTVRELLRDAIPPARAHGDNQYASGVSDTKSTSDQPDASYVVARLKRDNPDIAADVINGTITPNAAAIATGIRHPYARVRRDNINQAIRVLLRDYTRDQIMHALETD
jgi:hypothetical protein